MLNFMEILGYGPVVNVTLPMGEWILTLYVTDEAGNLEIATQPIRILNRVQFQSMPHVTGGVAISTYSMVLDFDEPQLPPSGVSHPTAQNKGKEQESIRKRTKNDKVALEPGNHQEKLGTRN